MLIERKEYLDKLLAWKDKQLIKVITGVRRCGKSTLMEMFQSRLKKDGVGEKRVLSVNFEDYDFYDLREPAKLYAYIKERLDPNAMNYIFLDEVQHVADFPRVVDSLYIKKNIDLYLTGSNAYMLSGEIATLLSGRYVEYLKRNTLPSEQAWKEIAASTNAQYFPRGKNTVLECLQFGGNREFWDGFASKQDIARYFSECYRQNRISAHA